MTLLFAGMGGLLVQDASAQLPADEPVRFGMDSASITAQRNAGVAPDYGTFWLGPWTLKYGWGGPDGQLDTMKRVGVTPAIHFYYWGDDIDQDCLQNGCWSSLHGAWKDQAGWQRLAEETVAHLNARMGGEPVVIFLETEFNKADVQTYEPLDEMLAKKAAFLKAGYPQAEVVLALGTWNTPAWKTWDRAAAASDYIGIQSMRGSTRDSRASYDNLYEATLAGARTAQATFGAKPVFVTDIALSSYPEPEYLSAQADALRKFFTGIDDLKAAGVRAMVYRSWGDSPNMDLANYYGEAERHWGFAWSGGAYKPSAKVWIDGVKDERIPDLTASFSVAPNVNEWWVETRVSSSNPLVRVEAIVDGVPFVLAKTAWGTWAKSFYVERGTMVTFRATDSYGQTVASSEVQWIGPPYQPPQASFSTSASGLKVEVDASASRDPNGLPMTFSWSFGDGATASGPKASHTYGTPGDYTVRLTVDNGRLTTTVAQAVVATQPNRAPTASFSSSVQGLTVRLDASASSDPDGDPLSFSWLFSDGTRAYGATATKAFAAGGTHSVRLVVSDGKLSTGSGQTFLLSGPLEAQFTPSPNANEWWVEVQVTPTSITRVEASVDGGAARQLAKTAWGTWAASFYAPRGSTVVFTAYNAGGQSAVSAPVSWLTTAAPTVSPAPTPSPLQVSFAPRAVGNDWWVETQTVSASTIASVDVRVNGGAWTALPRTAWGTWAKSLPAPDGSTVQFRATSSTGESATSGTFIWR